MAIVAASSELPAGIDTGIRFVTTDADAEHASMEEQGVDVDEVLRWPEVPPMFSLPRHRRQHLLPRRDGYVAPKMGG